jgi:hypothetical protein
MEEEVVLREEERQCAWSGEVVEHVQCGQALLACWRGTY